MDAYENVELVFSYSSHLYTHLKQGELFPQSISTEHLLEAQTIEEAHNEMHKLFPDHSNDFWTAWILYMDVRTTILEYDVDANGYPKMRRNINSVKSVESLRRRSTHGYDAALEHAKNIMFNAHAKKAER